MFSLYFTLLVCCATRRSKGYSRYSKSRHLRSLFWTIICLVRPLYEVNRLWKSIDLMFILRFFCKATCLLRPIFVENFSGRSKQVLLFGGNEPGDIWSWKGYFKTRVLSRLYDNNTLLIQTDFTGKVSCHRLNTVRAVGVRLLMRERITLCGYNKTIIAQQHNRSHTGSTCDLQWMCWCESR